MDREEDRAERDNAPANHNADLDYVNKTVPRSSVEAVSSAERLDHLVFDIARLIGRQMARDDYERRAPVTGNCDPSVDDD